MLGNSFSRGLTPHAQHLFAARPRHSSLLKKQGDPRIRTCTLSQAGFTSEYCTHFSTDNSGRLRRSGRFAAEPASPDLLPTKNLQASNLSYRNLHVSKIFLDAMQCSTKLSLKSMNFQKTDLDCMVW